MSFLEYNFSINWGIPGIKRKNTLLQIQIDHTLSFEMYSLRACFMSHTLFLIVRLLFIHADESRLVSFRREQDHLPWSFGSGGQVGAGCVEGRGGSYGTSRTRGVCEEKVSVRDTAQGCLNTRLPSGHFPQREAPQHLSQGWAQLLDGHWTPDHWEDRCLKCSHTWLKPFDSMWKLYT